MTPWEAEQAQEAKKEIQLPLILALDVYDDWESSINMWSGVLHRFKFIM